MKKLDPTKKLDKSTLDSMSKDQIDKHRIDFIRNSTWTNTDSDLPNRQYLGELDVYNDVRFKEDIYNKFDEFCVKSDDNKLKDIKDELLEFNVSVLKRQNGYDFIYYMDLITDLKKIGEFQYIKGIDIDIPEQYREIAKYTS